MMSPLEALHQSIVVGFAVGEFSGLLPLAAMLAAAWIAYRVHRRAWLWTAALALCVFPIISLLLVQFVPIWTRFSVGDVVETSWLFFLSGPLQALGFYALALGFRHVWHIRRDAPAFMERLKVWRASVAARRTAVAAVVAGGRELAAPAAADSTRPVIIKAPRGHLPMQMAQADGTVQTVWVKMPGQSIWNRIHMWAISAVLAISTLVTFMMHKLTEIIPEPVRDMWGIVGPFYRVGRKLVSWVL